MSAVRYARKGRRDTVTGVRTAGPLHVLVNWGGVLQSRCGRRLKGLDVTVTTEPQGEVCPACAKHLAAGTSQAWNRR